MKTAKTKKRRSSIPDPFMAYGYTRPDENGYIAICVNLSIFAQARTQEKAFKKLVKLILDYLRYVDRNHPDDWEVYINRPAPPEIMREFEQLAEAIRYQKELKKTLKKTLMEESKQQPLLLPKYTFATEVSPAYADAGV